MKNYTAKFLLSVLPVLAGLSGCTTTNATHAILYQQDRSTDGKYVFPDPAGTSARLLKDAQGAYASNAPSDLKTIFGADEDSTFAGSLYYGQNVIWVPDGCQFNLHLDALNPGWIHQGVGTSPNIKDSIDGEKGLKQAEAAYLGGKQLWVLVKMKQLVPEDPLELQAKTVNSCSVIQYDERSYELVPLDAHEINNTKMVANDLWSVEVDVYEVSGLEIKRLLARTVQNPPSGLTDLLKTVGKSSTAYATSLLGSDASTWVQNLGKSYESDMEGTNLQLEQILLEAGARLEFSASFSIKRFPVGATPNFPTFTQRYLVMDPFKGHLLDDSGQAYTSILGKVTGWNSELTSIDKVVPYLLLSVTNSVQPTTTANANGNTVSQAKQKAMNFLKTE